LHPVTREDQALTPAIKFLEKQGVAHVVRRYELGDSHEGSYGEAVAKAIGAEPRQVFKTLIAQLNSSELVVAVVPVSGTLDLRALAATAGAKSAAMAPPLAAEKATGYVTGGGISPFGQRKALRTFVDRSLETFSQVFVSAGRRGLQVEVSSSDLVRLCKASVAGLS
jgi:Cys-tRNA(Pro)/Cys-tRNA(Cys) deacylase